MIRDSSRMLGLVLLLPLASAQIFPTLFEIQVPSPTERTVNGSSETGHCSNITDDVCFQPTSSVLFDGIIPTLTGLDGDMWASQLLTIRSGFDLELSFAGTPDFAEMSRVEIVLFNCPEWGISVQFFTLRPSTGPSIFFDLTVSSCDSLVRVCIGNLSTDSARTDIVLRSNTINWVHIAEVTFYGDGPECQNETVLPNTPTPPPDTTNTKPSPADLTTHPETMCNTLCPTSSTPTILASILTAISTALLATVIFVLVQIALCKCCPKATPGRAESAPSAGGEGLAEYAEVNVRSEKGVARSGNEVGKNGTVELQENKAYGAGKNSIELQENKAYGAGKNSIELQENKAYGAGKNPVELQENKAYGAFAQSSDEGNYYYT